MDDPLLVRGVERVGDLSRNLERFRDCERPGLQSISYGPSLVPAAILIGGPDCRSV